MEINIITKKENILSLVKSKENIDQVKEVIKKLTPDPLYGPILMNLLNNYEPETRSFLLFLAKQIKPKTYLEIGTRRGWSAAMIVSVSPNCEIYSFDEWHENYGGSPNPGPKFVQSEMKKLGYNQKINFISGNSHITLKKFFKENPDKKFDMILVDGDHSVDGALQDLEDTINYINIGGALIFDDILDCCRLDEVWQYMGNKHTNFKFFTFMEYKPGVGFAVREK